jgi:cytochrome P450
MRNPIGFMQEAAQYGDLVTMSVKPALVYLVNHPDLIRDVVVTYHQKVDRGPNTEVMKLLTGNGLITATGADHLRQRRLIQPSLQRGRIERYSETMQSYAELHQDDWEDGERVDLGRELSQLTLRIVVKTLFGTDLADEVRRIGAAFALSNNYITTRANQPPRLRKLFHRLPLPYSVRFKRARADLDKIIYELIAERRESPEQGEDLLSLLMGARFAGDADGEPTNAELTDEQVRDETVTMFAAGHETTAVTLIWTCYLLATHPELQARFHVELDDVIGDRPATLDDLPDLKFMDQVLDEALRLYPPIWFWGRMSFQPFDLGGYHIPAGAFLLAPQLIAQRDPRFFEAPTEFRPDRWTPEFRANLPQFAYYPFGGGPRRCIGEGFAMMEAKLILATIGRRWSMRHDPRHNVEMLPLISLRPKGGMPMFLERRG